MAFVNPFGNPNSPQATFSHPISLKLDEKNFRQWKQQIEGVVRVHKLQKFITDPRVPPRFLIDSDQESDTVNPLYTEWEQQDALISTWLLASISDSLLSRVVDCVHSCFLADLGWDSQVFSHFDDY